MSRLPSLINEPMLETMRTLAAATPPGAFVEVGVYKGGSASVLYDVAQEQGRTVFLFDTFAGMPVAGPLDSHHRVGDFADCSADAVRAACPNAVVVVGVFPASFVETGLVAFVHADADQYESTLAVCEKFGPRMVPGGLMLFDDVGYLGCRHAIAEFFPDFETLEDGRAVVRF